MNVVSNEVTKSKNAGTVRKARWEKSDVQMNKKTRLEHHERPMGVLEISTIFWKVTKIKNFVF